MTRATHESVEQWFERVSTEFAQLQAAEKMHWERLGFGRKIGPGETSPTIDAEFRQVIERAKRAEAELRDASATIAGERNLLSQLLSYARNHLTDHDLSARSVAAAHEISVRHLYRLCAESGIKFEQWVIGQRLEGIRDELASSAGQGRPVFSVAWSWGFSDPRLFSRRFRVAYGVSPAQWQESSRQTQNS